MLTISVFENPREGWSGYPSEKVAQRRSSRLTGKVFITGYCGFGNMGDEAILAAMVAHLCELRPDLTIAWTTGRAGQPNRASATSI
jgi:exopolysaccharide biosynthesis predicted pyruvyltransferase EpsI